MIINFLSIIFLPFINCIEQIHIAQGTNYDSMVISWLSQEKTNSYVSYGINSNKLDLFSNGSINNYNFGNYSSNYIYHVTLNNLQPNTKYYYSCASSGTINYFTTLPKDLPIKLGIIGDLGQTEDSLLNINHILKDKEIKMILHAGDLSYADCKPELWDSYGKLIEPLSKMVPWMVGTGNHEIEYTIGGKLYVAFEERYKMPQIKNAEFGEIIIPSAIKADGLPYCCPSTFQSEYNYGNSFYSFNIPLAKIIYLNPYTKTDYESPQYGWFENELKTNKEPWIIIVMHCPWYNSNKEHQNEKQTILMQQYFEPLFYKYNVNLVITGHVHAYERTYPVYNNTVIQNGVTYITIGDGGNLEGHATNYGEKPSWSAYRNGTQYGHATLEIINKNIMYWKWYRNVDKQFVFKDYVKITKN